jgi:hypothetical protein
MAFFLQQHFYLLLSDIQVFSSARGGANFVLARWGMAELLWCKARVFILFCAIGPFEILGKPTDHYQKDVFKYIK